MTPEWRDRRERDWEQFKWEKQSVLWLTKNKLARHCNLDEWEVKERKKNMTWEVIRWRSVSPVCPEVDWLLRWVEAVKETGRKAPVIWVISVQICPLNWKVYAKCKQGGAVSREVCGNKLLMCFLFVAGRSYRDAWHKLFGLFGLFGYLALFHPLPAVRSFPFVSPQTCLL